MNYRILFTTLALTVVMVATGQPLVPLGAPEELGAQVNAGNWCGCEFLAAGGTDLSNGLIQIYGYNSITSALDPIGTTTTIGLTVSSVAWCSTCSFLAAGGAMVGNGFIQIYSFDPSNPSDLERIGSTTIIGNQINTLDWCQGCSFLAVGGRVDSNGFIQIYSFDPSNPGDLIRVGNTVLPDDQIYAARWCGDCRYLATADEIGNLSIYNFDPQNPGDLELQVSVTTKGEFTGSLDWCDDCRFIAIGGYTPVTFTGFIDIFSFDPLATPTLSLVASATIADDSEPTGLSWCTCTTLAASGYIGSEGVVLLYNFDQEDTLALQQTFTLGNWIISVDWCGDCEVLAGGGREAFGGPGIIQLFGPRQPTPPSPIASPTLRAQKICHRFPTQIDIINQICWAVVTDAVSYNVYANESLTTLLATITTAPFCYSQHQICPGRTITYFVTAVDAEGNESEPASITI